MTNLPFGTRVGMLRQWLNEERIKDADRFVTNEDIHHWLKTDATDDGSPTDSQANTEPKRELAPQQPSNKSRDTRKIITRILSRIQIYAKDNPFDVTAGDESDIEHAADELEALLEKTERTARIDELRRIASNQPSLFNLAGIIDRGNHDYKKLWWEYQQKAMKQSGYYSKRIAELTATQAKEQA